MFYLSSQMLPGSRGPVSLSLFFSELLVPSVWILNLGAAEILLSMLAFSQKPIRMYLNFKIVLNFDPVILPLRFFFMKLSKMSSKIYKEVYSLNMSSYKKLETNIE